MADYACEGILFGVTEQKCYRKRAIEPLRCQQDGRFELHVRADAFPPRPPSPPRPDKYLTSARCSAMMRDQHHKFWTMWSAAGWQTRQAGQQGCWGWDADAATQFFTSAEQGDTCDGNWNYNNGIGLHDAPAVFGFAETMQQFCARNNGIGDLSAACQAANYNILRVGNWNMCVNVRWMFCATQGKLHGQGQAGGQIIFSLAPKDLDVELLNDNLLPRCCGDYAENDIYYLEVCTLNELCANTDELFTVDIGDPFYCKFDTDRYQELQRVLRQWD